jgi:chaperonin GroES
VIPTPIEDRVIVKPIAPESVTNSGIILPDVAQEATHRGIVLAIGPGRVVEMTGRRIPVEEFAVGDEVLVSKYGGTELEHELDGEPVKLVVVRVTDILAVLARAGEVSDGSAD